MCVCLRERGRERGGEREREREREERKGERERGREIKRILPHSGKFLRKKIFMNFAILQPPAKVFTTKF
ncbi:MAG: hypothetical protein MJE68_28650 [Proteobacteria bacterium]|nr:hypothetical protein [Pseudomonadota bacterium]